MFNKRNIFIGILLVASVACAARFGNLLIGGNTISSLGLNQDIIISPNGTGDIDADSSKIVNLSEPTAAQDAATMSYVDTASANHANDTLDNLVSTAVNISIHPGADNTIDLGWGSFSWRQVYARIYTGNDGVDVEFTSQFNGDLRTWYHSGHSSGAADTADSTLSSGNQISGGTGLVGDTRIESGEIINAANANDTGDVILAPGLTAGAGARGEVLFDVTSLSGSSVGWLWALQNTTTGEGAWTVAPTSGNLWSDLVDANIVPDASPRNLGSPSAKFANVYSDEADLTISAAVFGQNWGDVIPGVIIQGDSTRASTAGASGILFESGSATNTFTVLTSDRSDASSTSDFYWGTGWNTGTGNTGPISFATGIQSGASGNSGTFAMGVGQSANGNSGDFQLTIGSASNGTQGEFQFFKFGQSSVIGQIWTATNTQGEGYWDDAPATGADLTLSNLSGTTSVGVILAPDGAGTRDMGTNSLGWRTVFTSSPSAGLGGFIIKDSLSNTRMKISTDVAMPSTTVVGLSIANDSSSGGDQDIGIHTENSAVANGTATGTQYFETGNKTAGNANSGDFVFLTGDPFGTGIRGKMSVDTLLLEVASGIKPVSVTADPCGDTDAFPESTQFYNDTSDYYCFCTGAGADVQMHSPATACF